MLGVETTRFNYQAPTKSDPAWPLQQELSQNAVQWHGRSPARQHHLLALNPGMQLLVEAEISFCLFLFLFKQGVGKAGHPTAETLLIAGKILAAFQMGDVHVHFSLPHFSDSLLIPQKVGQRVQIFQECAFPLLKHTRGWCLKWTCARPEILLGPQHPGSNYSCEGDRQELTHPQAQPFHYRKSCPEPWRRMNSPGGSSCPDSEQPVSVKEWRRGTI